jgi:hypothetical protein
MPPLNSGFRTFTVKFSCMRAIILLLLSIMTIGGFAQDENKSYRNSIPEDSLKTGGFAIHLVNNNFIKNNEYFGPYTEGITYIGASLSPEITYAFSSNARLSAGWYFRQYFGHDGLEKSLPLIRFEFDPFPGASIIMGQLHGGANHKYIEPVFSPDNYFNRYPEYGVQFLMNRATFHSDLWINWERYLFPGEAGQEYISAGNTTSFLTNPGKMLQLFLNFQFTIYHHGGQVSIGNEEPLLTRLNLAPGIELNYKTGSGFLKNIHLDSWFITSKDQSGTPLLPYISGYGLYNSLTFNTACVDFVAALWHGNKFFAPLGDNLFQSVSDFDPAVRTDKRDLLNNKVVFNYPIAKGVKLGLRFDSYLDLHSKHLDFSYGLNILSQMNWILKKGKQSAK